MIELFTEEYSCQNMEIVFKGDKPIKFFDALISAQINENLLIIKKDNSETFIYSMADIQEISFSNIMRF